MAVDATGEMRQPKPYSDVLAFVFFCTVIVLGNFLFLQVRGWVGRGKGILGTRMAFVSVSHRGKRSLPPGLVCGCAGWVSESWCVVSTCVCLWGQLLGRF